MSDDIRLSPSQDAAVQAPWERHMHMILSTAGSGKTLVLTTRTVRIAEHLLRCGATNARILCICFNSALADEMHLRIGHLLHERSLSSDISVSRTSYAITRAVTIEVRTFHGLGRYILNTAGPSQRQSVNLPQGNLKVLQGASRRKAAYDALKRSGHIHPTATEKSAKVMVSNVLAEVDIIKGKDFDAACEKILTEPTKAAARPNNGAPKQPFPEFDVYENYLYRNGATDYGDMIWKAVRLLLKCPLTLDKLRSRYASVLVDEFQDLSAAQLLLCKAAVDVSCSLTLVGDDDQQIYSWRMASEWYCHKVAARVFPNIITLVLPENRRCPANVVRAAYAVISHNSDRAPKHIRPVRSPGVPVRVVGCKSPELEVRFVVRCVQSLLEKTRSTGERILVLFRINDLVVKFEKEFEHAGVATTRSIQKKVKSGSLGTVTLMTLALVTLVAPSVDVDSFVWAAITVSPNLDARTVQEVLAEADKAENKSSTHETYKRERGTKSPYLARLRVWYAQGKEEGGVDTEGRLHGVYIVLRHTDTLDLKMRNAREVEEVVLTATELLSSSLDGVPLQESIVDGGRDFSSPTTYASDRAGYDVLLRAAIKVYSDSKKADSISCAQVKRRVRVIAVENIKGRSEDEDLEDFTELFAMDADKTKKKRRKASGIEDVAPTHSRRAVNRNVGRDVDEFCSVVRVKLGNYCDGWLRKSRKRDNNNDRDECVVLSTVHGVKGSQFDYVILCGVNKQNFPNGAVVSGVGINPCMNVAYGQGAMDPNGMHFQEERRVFFVAQTRAVTQFTCTYSAEAGNVAPKQFESMFISEMLKGAAQNSEEERCEIAESFVLNDEDIDRLVDT